MRKIGTQQNSSMQILQSVLRLAEEFNVKGFYYTLQKQRDHLSQYDYNKN